MKWKWITESVKTRAELEALLNSLENEGSKVITTTMDQATGGWIVIFKRPETKLFND